MKYLSYILSALPPFCLSSLAPLLPCSFAPLLLCTFAPLLLSSQNVTIKKNVNNDNLIWPLNPSGSIYIGDGSGSVATGIYNTGLGAYALNVNNSGLSNTAVGNTAMALNTSGGLNTAMGTSALYSNITGAENTAIGTFALYDNKGRSRSTAIGFKSMYYANSAASAGSTFNTAIGYEALRGSLNSVNNTGIKNTVMGDQAMLSNTSGSTNTAIGFNAMYANTTGFSNVALGHLALFSNTTRTNLVAVGDSALYKNGIGATQWFEAISNTAIGTKALAGNTTGYQNTGLGATALFTNSTGSNNTAIGSGSMYNNSTGILNTATGNRSLLANTTGSENTGSGYSVMQLNSTGNYNAAFGKEALYTNAAGHQNVAIGYEAGRQTTGSGNVFLGHKAGRNESGSNTLYIENSDADENNALIYGDFENDYLRLNARTEIYGNPVELPLLKVYGPRNEFESVITAESTSLGEGVGVIGTGFIGIWGIGTTNGSSDALGITGIANLPTSGKNVGVGGFAANGSINYGGQFDPNVYIEERLGIHHDPTHEIHIKQFAGNSTSGIKLEASDDTDNWIVNIDAANDYNFYFNGALKGYIRDNDGVYVSNSDRKLKQDIEPISSVLENLLQLNPSKYYYINSNNIGQSKTNGFIAQEVQVLFPEVVAEKNGYLGISYESMIPIAIKAIQEQQAIIDAQEARITKLEALVQELMAKEN